VEGPAVLFYVSRNAEALFLFVKPAGSRRSAQTSNSLGLYGQGCPTTAQRAAKGTYFVKMP
jgi:hypothetical protein